MKLSILIPIASLLFISSNLHAQNTPCTTIPLSYDSIDFATAVPASFGDSMITFSMTNHHPTQGFAYPLAKLDPLTPLPPGMTPAANNNPWAVFASSWNPGMTMPVHYYYNLTTPIPANYTVTYQLWISNLTPVITDSCYFDTTFTINLNPVITSVIATINDVDWSIIPNSSKHELNISWKNPLQKPITVSLFSVMGNKIMEKHAETGAIEKTIHAENLTMGIYMIVIEGENINKVVRKIRW